VPQLGEGEIELAWSDFQQLPTAKAMSAQASETPESSGQVIEFGSRDEAASDSTHQPTPSHADTEQTSASAAVESVDPMPAATESAEALFPETEPGTELETEPGTKEVELNHSIVCQNQMADETAENQKQHDAIFDPHKSPGEPAYRTPREQNRNPTGVSVTDFVGIDAEHIVQLNPESPDKPEMVPSEPEAAVETEAQQASGEPIWTVHQEPHTVVAAKDDSPRAASSDFAGQPTPPGKTHPLIPLQSRVISELICELQETHRFENDALKNLVQR
ncbi:MAG: hypothetical protein GY826_38630, partial [Fuerstiella sp.]|nr:hypothetical protein [Fuerstiella sp.]